jgi:glycosyltransferase involved in cell wall biosynthesis
LDLAVHALAQLPDEVMLELRIGRRALREPLVRLARAYAIHDRIHLSSGPSPTAGERLLFTSQPDEGAPLLQPGAHAAGALALGRVSPGATSVASMAELLHALDPAAQGSTPARGDDQVLAGDRVAIVTNLVTHYRMPLFNRIADRLARVSARLLVVTTGADPHKRTWSRPTEEARFEHKAVGDRSTPSLGTTLLGVRRELRRFSPTLVLAGGFGASSIAAVAYALVHRRPFGLWSGELSWLAASGSRLRHLERRALAARTDFAIAYGFHAREYLRSLAPTLPAVYGRNAVPIGEPPPAPGPGQTVEVLAVGRLAADKRLDVAIDAARELQGLPMRLTVIGTGPLSDTLRQRVAGLDNVRFLGAIPSDEILGYHRAADLFVFPSATEPFGLALVEAMGSGVAAVASATAGAVGDLSVNRVNSLVVDGHDPRSWAAALREAIEDAQLRSSLGAAAQQTVRGRWTLTHSAEAMMAGLRLGKTVPSGHA